jgi:hypothetical protein
MPKGERGRERREIAISAVLADKRIGDGARARICKRFRSPGIDSKESIPPAYVAWRAGTSNRIIVPAHQARNRFMSSLKGLQIRAQFSRKKNRGLPFCFCSMMSGGLSHVQ